MMIEAVNYDQISRTYDERYAARKLEGVEKHLLEIAKQKDVERVLEVGCGTGHWLRVLKQSGIDSYGLDNSPGMLQRALLIDQKLKVVCGNACSIPFSSGTFDLVFCVNALHLFPDPQLFIDEAKRILRKGGKLVIITAAPHTGQDQWYVYRYFDGAYERDLSRYSDTSLIADWMGRADFRNVDLSIAERICETMTGRDVFHDYFLKKDSTSLLASLSFEEYSRGLDRIKSAILRAEREGHTETFRVDIPLFMLVGEV